MNTPRRGIGKKTRFEVFKRDSFTCQYCGKVAPDVVLRVDHIHPVSQGGEDDVMNLITTCFDCNAGKSDRLLNDDAVIHKQRAQLEELNERREQLEMMLQWRDAMKDLDGQALAAFHEAWQERMVGSYLNENGLNSARKLIRKFGLSECLEALEVAATQYVKFDAKGNATQESRDLGLKKIGGICALRAMPETERELYYIRGILRNRLTYVHYEDCLRALRDTVKAGGDLDYLRSLAKDCRTWSQWLDWMADYLGELRGELWWQTVDGTLAEGKRLGVVANPGEEMDDYRSRIRRARGEQ